jgi:hypothetical protein
MPAGSPAGVVKAHCSKVEMNWLSAVARHAPKPVEPEVGGLSEIAAIPPPLITR